MWYNAYAIQRPRGGACQVAVAALLRHASTRTTERYTHLSRGDLKAAVNRKPVSE